ncbi:thiosulfate sulfurtransferase GlpE [Shewanella gelidii]|uniref:Thiosulfate sulfurtransferase GlpE n=1 Tax=Shewanella gelidii TaxID=1642821 RepID=A0A917N9Y4_9GAMM|nr:thiosulfate sulfurtransferase GlpE [Shewanella gelidii]MCL1099175.1 thiosulfate sulfurtransferase GlpE [Shewanella gelidii]GGI81129.1 thiosulfate sulfurtransferase GlpE [Shewanella gelidii]
MSEFQHLSVTQLQQMLKDSDKIQIADIRDPHSFAEGHIDTSIHLSNDNMVDFLRQADLDAPLVVVCYHGISSQNAALYLNQQGFDDIYSLDGGYQAWQQALS